MGFFAEFPMRRYRRFDGCSAVGKNFVAHALATDFGAFTRSPFYGRFSLLQSTKTLLLLFILSLELSHIEEEILHVSLRANLSLLINLSYVNQTKVLRCFPAERTTEPLSYETRKRGRKHRLQACSFEFPSSGVELDNPA